MRIHRANTIGLGLLILFGSAGKAPAWEDLGHTVVCAIAFRGQPRTTRPSSPRSSSSGIGSATSTSRSTSPSRTTGAGVESSRAGLAA
jgi:hypothetical protein